MTRRTAHNAKAKSEFTLLDGAPWAARVNASSCRSLQHRRSQERYNESYTSELCLLAVDIRSSFDRANSNLQIGACTAITPRDYQIHPPAVFFSTLINNKTQPQKCEIGAVHASILFHLFGYTIYRIFRGLFEMLVWKDCVAIDTYMREQSNDDVTIKAKSGCIYRRELEGTIAALEKGVSFFLPYYNMIPPSVMRVDAHNITLLYVFFNVPVVPT